MSEEQVRYGNTEGSNTAESIMKKIQGHKREHSVPGIWERYLQDVGKYIESKYPEIPAHVRLDISAYVATRGTICVNDMLIERDREYKSQLRKACHNTERYYKQLYGNKKEINS